MKQESHILKNEQEISTEISDDIEVIGPGRMLSDARKSMGLSQQQVADKLNFRKTLVQEIEAEQFDLSLPAAFNRGYLKNYAKLVNIAQDDVLNSYDQLGVAQRQCAEMQSFSKGTEKQAEHNMLMWITYLILVALITATVVWWYQAPSAEPAAVTANENSNAIINTTNVGSNPSSNTNRDINSATPEVDSNSQIAAQQVTSLPVANITENISEDTAEQSQKLLDPINSDTANEVSDSQLGGGESLENTPNITAADAISNQKNTTINAAETAVVPTLAELVFTFSGDCWVNIYDATGERVAWGVKKSGYVMTISGQAPFNVTLGKPELVAINYNDTSVDMTGFNAGNIAKFSLPLTP